MYYFIMNIKTKYIERNAFTTDFNSLQRNATNIMENKEIIEEESMFKTSEKTINSKKDMRYNSINIDRNFNNYTASLCPGRGFGNLNISNDIRNGGASRLDSREYREIRETQQTTYYNFSNIENQSLSFEEPRFSSATTYMPIINVNNRQSCDLIDRVGSSSRDYKAADEINAGFSSANMRYNALNIRNQKSFDFNY